LTATDPELNQTRPDRQPLFDLLRGGGMLIVVVGHWLASGLKAEVDPVSGQLHLDAASPLQAIPGAAPVTWLVGVLGVFFLVGGRLSAESWARADRRQLGYGPWLARRLGSFTGPALIVGLAVGGAALVAWTAGVSPSLIGTVLGLGLQPLWFLLAYAGLTALTPLAVRLDRWAGWAVPVALGVGLALIDLGRFGPWQNAATAGLAWLAVVPGWWLTFQLGVAWSSRPVGRPAAAALLAGAAAGLALLIGGLGYPAALSMAGGSDIARSNTHPPSLAVVTVMVAWVAAVWFWLKPLEALARRWRDSRLIAWSAGHPVAILAWHQPIVLLPALLVCWFSPGLSLPGLVGDPTAAGWLIGRLVWLPLFALGLIALTQLGRSRRPRPAVRPQLSRAA
jgi:hypothetical protein